MATTHEYAVGLRELRHNTSEVLARVRNGQIIDVTEYGKLVARIVPVEERSIPPLISQLVESGKAQLATRPGYRPKMRTKTGKNLLSKALHDLRAEENW